jgi:hypothetical protein
VPAFADRCLATSNRSGCPPVASTAAVVAAGRRFLLIFLPAGFFGAAGAGRTATPAGFTAGAAPRPRVISAAAAARLPRTRARAERWSAWRTAFVTR